MNAKRLLTGLAFAPLLFAAVPLLPSASHVSAAQLANITITATMVAMPQPTAPTSLFIQEGSETAPVWISVSTQIERQDGSPANLTDLHDNDSLKVTGVVDRNGGITASVIQDLSLLPLPTATATGTVVVPTPTVTVSATPTSSPTQVLSQLDVTGTLFAAPDQLTPPTLLCLAKAQVVGGITPNVSLVSPCAPGLLPVYITPTTKLTRNDDSVSALFELRAGDSLEVHGSFVNAQFTAASLDDHSLHLTYTQFTGSVQSVAVGSPLTVLSVMVTSLNSSHSPVPSNGQFTLPLTNAGTVFCTAPSNTQAPCTAVNINGAATSGYPVGGIGPGSVVTTQGLYNSALNAFEYISWITTGSALGAGPTATPVPTATATAAPVSGLIALAGLLNAPANPNTPPTLLCIKSARFTGGLSPNLAMTSPCRPGQLPVYVTPSTVIVRNNGNTIPVSYLHSNNRLEIRGTFVNAQFTATWIKDASLANLVQVRFKAKITFINFTSSPEFLAVRTVRFNDRNNPFRTGTTLTVFVQPSTIIYLRHNQTSHDVTSLNPGQTVLVWAYYDRDEHRVDPTMHITLM